jgi:4-carboxymuconolactone decarboxylase
VAESELFDKGFEVRREVLGADYVDANLAEADDFMMAFQRVLTEWAWGYAWSNPGLDHRTRSILNLGLLTALGRFEELGIYVKGALASGVTVPEIRDALCHCLLWNTRGEACLPGSARGLRGGGCLDISGRRSG